MQKSRILLSFTALKVYDYCRDFEFGHLDIPPLALLDLWTVLKTRRPLIAERTAVK
jgi:hypothetical protein